MTFTPNFFEVVAQIVPVIFLAMVVEFRDRREPLRGRHHDEGGVDEDAGDRRMFVFSLVLLVLAETISLWKVAGGTGGRTAGLWVASALAVATVLLLGSIILDIARREPSRRGQYVLLGGFVVGGLVVVLGVMGTLLS